MANVRMTIGTVLGTVSDSAVAVSTILGTGIKGINMLDEYVNEAALKQKKRSLIEMSSFETKLMEEVAQEDSVRQLQVQEFMDKTPAHRKLYIANYNRLGKILAESRNEKWVDVADEAGQQAQ